MPRNPLLCAISWYHHGMQGNVAVVDSQLLSERQRSWALADSPWEELTVCFAEVGGGGGGHHPFFSLQRRTGAQLGRA
jgi:hypothetical protein